MPSTFRYQFNIDVSVAMLSEDEITATRTKAQNFVDNQISLGRISEDSRVDSEYKNSPGRVHPYILNFHFKLYISDLSPVEPIANSLVSALDTFDEVLDYYMYTGQKLTSWTRPDE